MINEFKRERVKPSDDYKTLRDQFYTLLDIIDDNRRCLIKYKAEVDRLRGLLRESNDIGVDDIEKSMPDIETIEQEN